MDKLLKGLHKFQTDYFQSHRELFEQLSHGQAPRILFITCSDSRIDPNLITGAEVGELFVIRNAGNIIPPYGSSNGGEGASLEYAIQALGIEQIIVCGHSHCGAMKGLLKIDSLADKMPLVYDWLKYAEATRRVVKDNYTAVQGEELLNVTIAENVLTQLENLHTYPIIRSKLHAGQLSLHGWIYSIETAQVLAYDAVVHDFVAPHSRLPSPEHEYNLHYNSPLPGHATFTIPVEKVQEPKPQSKPQVSTNAISGYSHLSAEQANRIYRGSRVAQ
jgi:carbonic anhydrase